MLEIKRQELAGIPCVTLPESRVDAVKRAIEFG